MTRDYSSNIWKLYLIKGGRYFLLIMPIIVLFLTDNGLSMAEVMILQSIFSLGIIVLEIPSGYIADVYGRKTTLIIATIVYAAGSIIYAYSYSFLGFLLAELVLGLGISFMSGSDSALLYDSLIQIKKENEYNKFEGRATAIGGIAEGIAGIIGGSLAVISLRTPFIAQIVANILIIPLALSLHEPPRNKLISKNPFRDIARIVKYSLHEHREIKWLIIYSSILGVATLNLAWFVQPYFLSVGLPLALFGLMWALLHFVLGFASIKAYKIEQKLGVRKILQYALIIILFGHLGLYLFGTLWSIGFIFIMYSIRGIAGPVFKDYVNKRIESNIRATVLSVKNLSSRLFFSILGPLFGVILDVYTVEYALLSAGLVFFISGSIALLFLKKYKVF